QEEVVVSLFAPEALYRLRATASRTAPEGTVVLDPVHDVERIQRRKAMRTAIRLGVTFSFLDGPDAEIASVVGRTIDVGLGGLRAETMRPFPAGAPTVMMTL